MQRDPIQTAKEVASLDNLSGGRFLFGIGGGWNEEEMQDHGVDPSRRRSVAREKVLAMRELWTQDEATFEGEFVHFPPTWSWPKPVSSPHPPIIMGGAGGPITFRHVVEFCDGWMPIHGRRSITDKLDDLRRAADEAGRDMTTIELGVFGCPPEPQVIDDYAALGFRRCALIVPPTGEDAALRALDRYVAANPAFLFEGLPEEARLDPDNIHVLLAHIRAAAFELPFEADEAFGPGPADDLLAFLAEEGHVRQADDGRWYWSSENFPASEVSLRVAAPENVLIIDTGPDRPRAPFARSDFWVQGLVIGLETRY